jgi:hypothetical protein
MQTWSASENALLAKITKNNYDKRNVFLGVGTKIKRRKPEAKLYYQSSM